MLITFAFLYIWYSKLVDTENIKAHNATLGSIEWQWLKTDQNIFVAGILLNPFHKAQPFCAAPFSTVARLYNLLHHLWRWFYYDNPPAELYAEYRAYMTGTGDFQAMYNFMQGMQALAEKEVCHNNYISIPQAVSDHSCIRAQNSIHLKFGMPYLIQIIHWHPWPNWHTIFFPFVPTLLHISGVCLAPFSLGYGPNLVTRLF